MTTATGKSPTSRAVPAVTGLHHLGLTVRDIAASEAWYTQVPGLAGAFAEPHPAGGGYAAVMTRPGTGLFVGWTTWRFSSPAGTTSTRGSPTWTSSASSTERCPRARSRRRTPWWCSATRTGYRSSCSGPAAEMAAPLHLPPRAGSRPRTSTRSRTASPAGNPATPRHTDAILAEALTWPSVHEQRSAISVDGARALTLDAATAAGPAEAFMAGREFCHVHAQGDFSLHATLPLALAAAGRAGWAGPHFLVRTGQAPATVVMLYAPRDDLERNVVLRPVRASYHSPSPRAASP